MEGGLIHLRNVAGERLEDLLFHSALFFFFFSNFKKFFSQIYNSNLCQSNLSIQNIDMYQIHVKFPRLVIKIITNMLILSLFYF